MNIKEEILDSRHDSRQKNIGNSFMLLQHFVEAQISDKFMGHHCRICKENHLNSHYESTQR
ncbi:hypothetical protein V1478_001921 [Vespula squamosa]|uniref:Uncharacterized protein n=1 Tax=Vespula squamosa TaxID=30214 RepID=A0ABD2BYL1_VESSQ